MKALLLDVGNSRLKWGVAEDGSIRRTGQVARQKLFDEGMNALTAKLPRDIDTAFASNVAGADFAARLSGVIDAHCGCDLRFATTAREACGVRNGYRQTRRLGVDRWMAMIGAWDEVRTECIVVDAGTAVTIDALDANGAHLGGQILPGVTLMMSALATETSDIPDVRRRRRISAQGMQMFGRTTASAVANGALNAVAGAIERAESALRESGCEPVVVLTGGDASSILDSLAIASLHRPHLVLHGLLRMLESRQ